MTETEDPYCLRPGEAADLLAGHPWRRFAVLGDSVAEGLGDASPGYDERPWADRIASALGGEYVNLGRRGLLAAQVRETQLADALAFRPDLALVACGGNDAFRPGYDPAAVDAELTTMITALREAGAEVITVGMFDISHAPAVPERMRASLGARMRRLSAHTAALGERLGTIHVELTAHPAVADPTLYSSDGLHGNGRSHAISGAEAIRRLGAHLRTRAASR